jgi:hypothetical protein
MRIYALDCNLPEFAAVREAPYGPSRRFQDVCKTVGLGEKRIAGSRA